MQHPILPLSPVCSASFIAECTCPTSCLLPSLLSHRRCRRGRRRPNACWAAQRAPQPQSPATLFEFREMPTHARAGRVDAPPGRTQVCGPSPRQSPLVSLRGGGGRPLPRASRSMLLLLPLLCCVMPGGRARLSSSTSAASPKPSGAAGDASAGWLAARRILSTRLLLPALMACDRCCHVLPLPLLPPPSRSLSLWMLRRGPAGPWPAACRAAARCRALGVGRQGALVSATNTRGESKAAATAGPQCSALQQLLSALLSACARTTHISWHARWPPAPLLRGPPALPVLLHSTASPPPPLLLWQAGCLVQGRWCCATGCPRAARVAARGRCHSLHAEQ